MNNYTKYSKSIKKYFVGAMSTPQRAFGGEAGRRLIQARDFWGPVSVCKSRKIDNNTIWKKHETNAAKKMKNHAEKVSQWSRNGTKTNEQSIQKQVTGKIMKIIKNHVSLNGKIIEIHCKNKSFWWFRRLHVRTVRVSKKHQKWNQHPWKINAKTMVEQMMAKWWKPLPKWSLKRNQNP